jgi:hypothetical protein
MKRITRHSTQEKGRPVGLVRLSRVVALAVALCVPLYFGLAGHAQSSTRLGSADYHLFAGELEINLALTESENACGTGAVPPPGNFCLRYTVVQDERLIAEGHGLIPSQDVKVSPSSITLSTHPAAYSSFHARGTSGAIAITWALQAGGQSVTAAHRTSTLVKTLVHGNILNRQVTTSEGWGSVLNYH